MRTRSTRVRQIPVFSGPRSKLSKYRPVEHLWENEQIPQNVGILYKTMFLQAHFRTPKFNSMSQDLSKMTLFHLGDVRRGVKKRFFFSTAYAVHDVRGAVHP